MTWSRIIHARRTVDIPIAMVAEYQVDIGRFDAADGYHDTVMSKPMRVGGCVLYANFRTYLELGPCYVPMDCEVTLWGLDVVVVERKIGLFKARIQMNMDARSSGRTELELDIQVNRPCSFLVVPLATLYMHRLDAQILRWKQSDGTKRPLELGASAHLDMFRQYALAQSVRSGNFDSVGSMV